MNKLIYMPIDKHIFKANFIFKLKKIPPNVIYAHIMLDYSAIKNKIMSFVEKCMQLAIIMLHKISQTEKDKYHIFYCKWKVDLKKNKDVSLKGRLVGSNQQEVGGEK
jgi:hypothetical protein